MEEPPEILKAMAIFTIVGIAVLLLGYGLLYLFPPTT